MTTIVWDGANRTLAADAMATITYRNNPVLQNENVYKLVDLASSNLVSRTGERLLAVGVAGMVSGVPQMIDYIINGLGHWEAAAKSVSFYGGVFMPNGQKSVSALLVTNKFVHFIHMENGVTHNRFPLGEFIAIGSGGEAAYTAHRAFGVNAEEAILAAATTDPGTGFLVIQAKVTAKGLTDHHGRYYNDVNEAVLALRKRVPSYKEVDAPKRRIKMKDRFGDVGVSKGPKFLEAIRKREADERKTIEATKRKEREEKKAKKVAKVADTAPATGSPVKKAVTPSRRKNQQT